MTPSCTAALEMAAMLCDLGPGDEVIVPSFTFVSTANAFVRLGARPVFVEIRPDTLNLDEARIEAAITPRTRAIFPVHYAGVGCEMDQILAIARPHSLLVVEDAAQGVNAFYKGRALGSIGRPRHLQLPRHQEPGLRRGRALCVNDPELIERAEILRDKGTNRAKFFRGEVDKYTWVDVGSSYIPSEIACAFLCAQLEAMDAIKARRRAIDRCYRERLAPLEEDGPAPPAGHPGRSARAITGRSTSCSTTRATRDALMDAPQAERRLGRLPLRPAAHARRWGRRFGYQRGRPADHRGPQPAAPAAARRSPRSPSREQDRVADLVAAFLRARPAADGGDVLVRGAAAATCQEARAVMGPRSRRRRLRRRRTLSIVVPVYRSARLPGGPGRRDRRGPRAGGLSATR